jgi:hypothetical protein
MPEMTIGAKIGMTLIVLSLVSLLFVYHWLFTPAPPRVATRGEPEGVASAHPDEARTNA